MVGKDLAGNFAARREAQRRIKGSRLVFTTCAGAGLGLLRTESFEVVLVDEASQQTEPETLIPLVKGCQRAVLVGDHVQLRATVQKNAVVAAFDVSLFERHYNVPERPGVAKVMLDTQYRMHRDICEFSSAKFYQGKLRTAVADDERPLAPCQFPWPSPARKVFIQCSSPEDLGRQSKSNKGQVELCRRVCELLSSPPEPAPSLQSGSDTVISTCPPPEIAILTPYTHQKDLLKSAIPKYNVSSIDGYQGREADVIIFVTVRSNLHCETGFLKDMRRLNVAMTRAKAGVIIIGDRATLTGVGSDNDDTESRRVWKNLLDWCTEIKLQS
jgi:superfamily I DNA and/or RNA helicase